MRFSIFGYMVVSILLELTFSYFGNLAAYPKFPSCALSPGIEPYTAAGVYCKTHSNSYLIDVFWLHVVALQSLLQHLLVGMGVYGQPSAKSETKIKIE